MNSDLKYLFEMKEKRKFESLYFFLLEGKFFKVGSDLDKRDYTRKKSFTLFLSFFFAAFSH
jgi:hypothetical protein